MIRDVKLESINLPASFKTAQTGPEWNIYKAPSLNCVSYFGSNNISFQYLFYSVSSSFVAHSLPNYPYKIGTYEPRKDGIKCPEKAFEFQIKKSRNGCSCKIIRCSKSSLFLFSYVFLVYS